MKKSLLSFLLSCLSIALLAQNKQATYCNPIDIGYRYNFEQMNEGISYRSGADPVIVTHKNEYYLFVTISGGWWHSKDLVNWNYVVPDKWPMEDMCAPAAVSVRDTLYLFQSTFQQRPIFYSTEPEKGKLKFLNRWLPQLPKDIGPWDPALFHDPDTDKWYMYWGSSNVYPIFGAELDKSRNLTYKDKTDYKPLIFLDQYQHGWERFGPDHSDMIKPFIEGAWMTKHNGKYYLQYAGPGTEYNVYGNGTYVGDNPLGPFTYASYNPISYRPGGYMTGAGHGNTFQDVYGNYWNTGTPWLAVNWPMERRISMFPAGFDKEGQMYSNTRFGDWPHYLPTGKWDNRDALFTGWMLLSYKKPVTVSSQQDTIHVAKNLTDEGRQSFWVAKQNKAGEWASIDLGRESEVRALQVNYIDYKNNVFDSDSSVYTLFKIWGSKDGKKWELLRDLTKEPKRDRPCAYIELEKPYRGRFIKYEHVYVKAQNLAIGEIRVFGNGLGQAPTTPQKLVAKRQKDERNVDISWEKVPNAVGYNIRWGIEKDKLYQTYQVYADQPTSLQIRALNLGQKYYYAIEAFNENGVSTLSGVVGE
ncbi:family 43 glycosylhydrolase [Flectobacillus sp. BAB-3569]|uniref:family 43 glycosylhydrolase n=1 Tax=Flectobacillus sp. BAB-3569 TaxID=1509483 RepID=UPI000BA3F06F|nr:family 43 glycosylhydrolase [Flectobacillus sp. BAB-3569]PAC28165.1 coagulation factor 5/8 type domain protein [Flectobacillus sp. BAB-3569]